MRLRIALSLSALVILIVVGYVLWTRTSGSSSAVVTPVPTISASTLLPSGKSSLPTMADMPLGPAVTGNVGPGGGQGMPMATEPRLDKLTEISFEHALLGPGYAPDARAMMAVKKAGTPPYKLVNCDETSAYSIRWSGRWLTVVDSGKLEWSVSRRVPNSCFKIESGYCNQVNEMDGANFVMLRSMFNRHFVRPDDSYNLVCMDGPTSRNAAHFCFRLTPNAPQRTPCGQPRFYEEYGRVLNIPCDIVRDPDPSKGIMACGDVTPGFKSECCSRHPNDPTCKGNYFREVVGRTVPEVLLYLKTRRPDLEARVCPKGEPCNKLHPFPLHDEKTVVVPIDKRLNTVYSPAFRWV